MTERSSRRITVEISLETEGALEPVVVRLTNGGPSLRVLGINDRWYDEQANYFNVRLQDGSRALVRHDLDSGDWSLVKREFLDA